MRSARTLRANFSRQKLSTDRARCSDRNDRLFAGATPSIAAPTEAAHGYLLGWPVMWPDTSTCPLEILGAAHARRPDWRSDQDAKNRPLESGLKVCLGVKCPGGPACDDEGVAQFR